MQRYKYDHAPIYNMYENSVKPIRIKAGDRVETQFGWYTVEQRKRKTIYIKEETIPKRFDVGIINRVERRGLMYEKGGFE